MPTPVSAQLANMRRTVAELERYVAAARPSSATEVTGKAELHGAQERVREFLAEIKRQRESLLAEVARLKNALADEHESQYARERLADRIDELRKELDGLKL